jgi:hypothetical protein
MNGCRISKVEQSIFFTCLTTFCSVLRVPVAKTMETEAGITGGITADVMGLGQPHFPCLMAPSVEPKAEVRRGLQITPLLYDGFQARELVT